MNLNNLLLELLSLDYKEYLIYLFSLSFLGFYTILFFLGLILSKITLFNKIIESNRIITLFFSFLALVFIVIIFFQNKNIYLLASLLYILFISLVFLFFIIYIKIQEKYSFISFLRSYKILVLLFFLSSFIYFLLVFKDSLMILDESINKKVENELRVLKRSNQEDYKLTKILSTHYLSETNKYKESLDLEKNKTFLDIKNKIKLLDNKNTSLNLEVNEYKKRIKNLEEVYSKKILSFETSIDEKNYNLQVLYKNSKESFKLLEDELKELQHKYKKQINLSSKTKFLTLQTEVTSLKKDFEKEKRSNTLEQKNKRFLIKELQQKNTFLNKQINSLNNEDINLNDNFIYNEKTIKYLNIEIQKLKKELQRILAVKK